MKGKIGIAFMATVVGLLVIGAGYATWSKTLYIKGDVNTGKLDVYFENCKSNDPSSEGSKDPKTCGTWTYSNIDNPNTWIWDGERYQGNIASIDCSVEDSEETKDTLHIELDGAYPGYYGSVAFSISNKGNVPIGCSLKLTATSYGEDGEGWSSEEGIELTKGQYCTIDINENDPSSQPTVSCSDTLELNHDIIIYVDVPDTIDGSESGFGYICIVTGTEINQEAHYEFQISLIAEIKLE